MIRVQITVKCSGHSSLTNSISNKTSKRKPFRDFSCTGTLEVISVENVMVMPSGQLRVGAVAPSFDEVKRNSFYGQRDSCSS